MSIHAQNVTAHVTAFAFASATSICISPGRDLPQVLQDRYGGFMDTTGQFQKVRILCARRQRAGGMLCVDQHAVHAVHHQAHPCCHQTSMCTPTPLGGAQDLSHACIPPRPCVKQPQSLTIPSITHEQDYAYFADVAFKSFGDLVKNWITFNEPTTLCKLGYNSGYHAPGVLAQSAPQGPSDDLMPPHFSKLITAQCALLGA